MEVRTFDDAGQFAAAAADLLERDPFSPSVIAVHVDGVCRGLRPAGSEDRFWTVGNGGEVVGLAMHTPPHNLFLSRMTGEAVVALARALSEAGRALSGVNGELVAVGIFCDEWSRLTGQRSSPDVAMRMYRLGELVRPRGVRGTARLATTDDLDTVSEWAAAFHEEAQPHAPVIDWRVASHQRIGAGQLCLWEDHGAVTSMAGFSAPVAGVSRVGPVYTPPSERRCGYGAAVTAEATSAALASGASHVVLYTDLSNPTSNAIYQTIGYRPDHDAEERSFIT